MEMVILRRIHHRDKDRIAIFFKSGQRVDAVVRNMNEASFSITHRCWYVEDTPENFELILKRLNGIANIDQSELSASPRRPAHTTGVAAKEVRETTHHGRAALKALQDKLKLQGNSETTYRTYSSQFELFLQFYKYSDPMELEEGDISAYLLHLVGKKLSRSSQNQAINAIKFFYEKVARQERRTYYVERPLERRLPTVFSEEEVVRLIVAATNLKHKLMLMITYSGGLRRSEVLNLKPGDVDPDRGVIFVRGGKGRKDRRTTLGRVTPHLAAFVCDPQA